MYTILSRDRTVDIILVVMYTNSMPLNDEDIIISYCRELFYTV